MKKASSGYMMRAHGAQEQQLPLGHLHAVPWQDLHEAHHVQDTLVVGDDDTGLVFVQIGLTPDLKAEAIHVLEGSHKPADDAHVFHHAAAVAQQADKPGEYRHSQAERAIEHEPHWRPHYWKIPLCAVWWVDGVVICLYTSYVKRALFFSWSEFG